jgi:hydroxyethylthiazole kinase-like uncharacterized protein yjeF
VNDLLLQRPTSSDNKYSRGVVGFITGSKEYAGAAILGTTAAIRAGVGMVRYIGPDSVSRLVLESRPEVVLGSGRAQAWVLGSGVAVSSTEQIQQISSLLNDSVGEILIMDAGALDLLPLEKNIASRCIVTPHLGEASRLYERISGKLALNMRPSDLATALHESTECTVLLKGSKTLIADASGIIECPQAPSELATAGTGDVLAGVIGALAAINFDEYKTGRVSLSDIAEAGVMVHSKAAEMLAKQGPIAALDLANAVSKALVALRN